MACNFLQGNLGKDVFEEFKGIVKTSYKDNPYVDVLKYNIKKDVVLESAIPANVLRYNTRKYVVKGLTLLTNVLEYNIKKEVVLGSTIPVIILVNFILRKYGFRVANQADIWKELSKKDGLNFNNFSIETGLVLVDNKGIYESLANNLINKIKELQEPEFPLMIPLSDLDLVPDKNSKFGFGFNLIEGAKIIYEPILSQTRTFSIGDINKETGLPKKLKDNEKHHFYGG